MRGRILIVDDSEECYFYLKTLFELNGFTVVGNAPSLSTVVDLYEKLKPDIVTMDIVMPGGNGYDAIKALLSHDPEARIIVLSTSRWVSSDKQANELGVLAYADKMAKWDVLEGVFAKALA